MEKYEIVKAFTNFEKRLADVSQVIEPPKIISQIADLEQASLSPAFWDDAKNATRINQTITDLKERLNDYQALISENEELKTIIDLDDEELFLEAENIVKNLEQHLTTYENELLLNEEYDNLPAIVELHPGAGGTESQDWALMLYRMYKRYAERKKFNFQLIDYQEGNDAGLKSVTFIIEGKHAYGLLKSEKGVHRLVRISPFDSNARRHTSFVGCTVIPEVSQNANIEINPDDIRIDTYRASGAGGQHINKTDSAVRITHFPSGIVVSCQNERSQIQNREQAMRILKSKLSQLYLKEQSEKMKSIGGASEDNAFGSQIRSYVLHPYAMVKDHRTELESSNPNDVLDGNIDDFLSAYLKYYSMNKDKE